MLTTGLRGQFELNNDSLTQKKKGEKGQEVAQLVKRFLDSMKTELNL